MHRHDDEGDGPRLAGPDQHLAGDVGRARLDAVAPRVVQQPVVVLDGHRRVGWVADHRRLGAHEFPEHRIAHGESPERRQVTGAGVVPRPGSAPAVDEVRVRESQVGGARVHERGEGVLTAGHVGGEREGGVVGALDHEREERLAHGDAVAGDEIDADRLGQRDVGDGRVGIEVVDVLQHEQRRHDLRARGRFELPVRRLGPQHLAGVAHDDDAGSGLDLGWLRALRGGGLRRRTPVAPAAPGAEGGRRREQREQETGCGAERRAPSHRLGEPAGIVAATRSTRPRTSPSDRKVTVPSGSPSAGRAASGSGGRSKTRFTRAALRTTAVKPPAAAAPTGASPLTVSSATTSPAVTIWRFS